MQISYTNYQIGKQKEMEHVKLHTKFNSIIITFRLILSAKETTYRNLLD